MTALVASDLHLSANPRDSYRFRAMETLAGLIEKHKVDTLLVLGDLCEEKDHHPATLVNDVVEVFHAMSGLVARIMILMGNHDYKDADTPFFSFLRRLKNISWISVPTAVDIPGVGRCLFLPHTQNYERDWDGVFQGQAWLGTARLGTARQGEELHYIFAHNTFTGAVTEHGKKLSGIPTSVFPKGVPVISGDIHTPQTLGPVTYCGSPYTVDFGDSFQPRVLLLSRDKMTSIPIPGPQKRLVELKKNFIQDDFGVNDGDVVKVRYKLTAAEREKWPEIRARIRTQLEDLGCMVYAVQPVLDKAVSLKSAAPVKHSVLDDESLVRGFGQRHKLSAEMVEVGVKLLG